MSGETVTFEAADGRRLAATLWPPPEANAPGVVLVPASSHERDAYGQTLPPLLAARAGVLAVDIRGRGGSRDPVRYTAMGPEQRRAVRLDVAAAVAFLAGRDGVDAGRVALVVEQDTAQHAVEAWAAGARVACAAFVSGRLGDGAVRALGKLRAPLLCLVSKEDRSGLRAMVDAYLASRERRSRIAVYEGLGFGTTMFSAWQFLNPGSPPIEETIATWLLDVLGAGGAA